ncbi:hypothetical protein [Mucilaginibacter sp. SP1R1]|uniref:hypothetical protein n=1 Tax=Mucilaginibacter sp. SP1R1 TaxID=2723091 RepID=UPI001607F959|nr:hypothetical protein [Mucilaginibacter sp. SP1R1]MBB6148090.1 hypothetical protein [Mucilaginibacter sp. SP1R1]
MKIFSLILILYCFTIYKAKAQDDIGNNRREKKVLKLINSLPEVKRASRYIIKHSDCKRVLKAFIQNTPTQQQNYYLVSVSEFNGMNLVSHYWFEVDAATYVIRYYDIIDNKLTPLKEWQKHPRGVYSK